MSLIDTSDWMFRRRLRNLRQLLDEGLISEELYEQHRKRAMDWRADRPDDRAPVASSRPKPLKKRAGKPIDSPKSGEPPAAIPEPEG